MNKDETKLEDLNEWINSIKSLPAWVKLYSLNHHSPSQINEADDMWGYKYLYLTQEERRKLPGNSKMKSGMLLVVWVKKNTEILFGNMKKDLD